MKVLRRGDKITYTRHYMFGKSGKETATVIAINGNKALLDNGDEIFKVIQK